jgi:hypothetical protein
VRRVGTRSRRGDDEEDGESVARRVAAVPIAAGEEEIDDAIRCLAALLLDRRAGLADAAAIRRDGLVPRRKAA